MMSSNYIYRAGISVGSLSLSHVMQVDYSGSGISVDAINAVSEFGVYALGIRDTPDIVFSYMAYFSEGTPTHDLLYTYASETFEGQTFYPASVVWLIRMKWGEKDYLVGETKWITAESNSKVVSRVFVFDLEAQAVISNNFFSHYPTLQVYSDPDQVFHFKPQQYENKLIWSDHVGAAGLRGQD